jgi:hypothetical protein
MTLESRMDSFFQGDLILKIFPLIFFVVVGWAMISRTKQQFSNVNIRIHFVCYYKMKYQNKYHIVGTVVKSNRQKS